VRDDFPHNLSTREGDFDFVFRSYVLKLEHMRKISSRPETKIPNSLQPILWSKNVKNLDLEKDKVYIIHQVLSFGNFEQIKWLFNVYGQKEIREVFLKYPKKIYTASMFNFVKNFILDLEDKKLLEEKYVKTLFQTLK